MLLKREVFGKRVTNQLNIIWFGLRVNIVNIFKELSTILTQIKAYLNSRQITIISYDLNVPKTRMS